MRLSETGRTIVGGSLFGSLKSVELPYAIQTGPIFVVSHRPSPFVPVRIRMDVVACPASNEFWSGSLVGKQSVAMLVGLESNHWIFNP
jgi:hypothetical protein